MQVYRPSQSKISTLKQDNPAYWALLLTRSEYSESEIEQALTVIDEINDKLHAFLSTAYDLLVFGDGREMNYIPNGFASDAHQKLNGLLSDLGGSYIYPDFSANSHLNCFPVVKWLKEVARLNNQIAKVEKFIKSNF